jgi:type I restriction enzyme S subunit
MENLREDWVEVELGKICSITSGYAFKKNEYSENGVRLFQIANVSFNESSWDKIAYLPANYLNKKEYQQLILNDGDIVMALNRPMLQNRLKITLLTSNDTPAILYQRVGKLNINTTIYPKIVLYYLQSPKFIKWLSDELQGVNIPFINQSKLFTYKAFPLFSLSIQRAIVAKIENLFTSLDKGIADLEKAQQQLKVYRQAVLKKAFEGELTKEWRKKQTNPSKAEELLIQLKRKQQNQYEQQINEWKKTFEIWNDNGKNGRIASKPKIWNEVANFTKDEIDSLPKLPVNWKWVKLGNIFQVFVGSTPTRSKNEYWENGNINWISSGEVAFNTIFTSKEKITQKGLDNASTTLHPKGTVMLAMIGEGKTRGQAAILETVACHNQNTAAIRVSEMGLEPKFLFHYLFLKYERNRRVGSGNNQKALNQRRILEFDYPLCSMEEQHQIVREIETRLSVCDKVEQSITESLETSKALRQSILKKAFDGKLLSDEEIAQCRQAGDYEPAGELLKKIHATKK